MSSSQRQFKGLLLIHFIQQTYTYQQTLFITPYSLYSISTNKQTIYHLYCYIVVKNEDSLNAVYIKNLTMEKGNINVIIFDDEQPLAKDSRTVHSSKHIASSHNHHIDIIEQQIAYLTDKIKSLEQQTQSYVHLKNQSHLSHKNSRLNQPPNEDHTKEILLLIQKKIQIIVRETKKLVGKMSQNFEKKLEAKYNKRQDQSGLTKIKENYIEAIKKVELGYKKEVQRISKEHKQVETKMLARVNNVQQRFSTRMKQFDTKEKEYINWIHHLEIQLKEKSQISSTHQAPQIQQIHQIHQVQQAQVKSKRMIEVTHITNAVHKKQNQQSSSIITGDNNSSAINQRGHKQVSNDSKIQRRHRIFDPINKNSSSVSPNQRVVSPLSVQQPQLYNTLNTSKVVNPQIKPRLTEVINPISEPSISPVTRMTEPLKNNFTNVDNQASPWRVIDKSVEKSYRQPTKRNQIVKDVNEQQFYKDVPKANQGWQKFQDFNQLDNSSRGSEEDVIFYRNEDKNQEFGQNLKQNWRGSDDNRAIPNIFEQSKKQSLRQNEPKFQLNKVFSPFDLN